MAHHVATLMSQLTRDDWRTRTPFSDDFASWHERIVDARDDESVAAIENEWLQRHQPCLFGRLAAKAGAITYCILSEDDLARSDEEISQKIQTRRLEWSRAAFNGRSSAFVIVAASNTIASAVPDRVMGELARRITSLYLRREIDFDTIYTDEIALEFPGEQRLTRVWQVGVNYFSAQADRRWWRDHRMPGGLSLSMNSVGHLVRSGKVQNAFELLKDDIDERVAGGHRIDSLAEALEFAMRTVNMASEGASGKATHLLDSSPGLSPCPVTLPKMLQGKNHCTYWGWYHTDVTLPAEYFLPNEERPTAIAGHELDFTYLFLKDVDNPDHETMGEGRRIRARGFGPQSQAPAEKRLRSIETVKKIEDTSLLREALGQL